MKLNATKDGRKAVLRPGGTGKDQHDSQNSIALLQLDRLQLTAVYCNRRGV